MMYCNVSVHLLSIDDSIWIQHGNNLEDVEVTEVLSRQLVTQQVVNGTWEKKFKKKMKKKHFENPDNSDIIQLSVVITPH